MHRWLGLTVAAALVVEFGSGTLLLYRRELAGDGPAGPFWGTLLNLHDCGLACPGLPGHLPVLAAAVPGLGGTTWGGLGLGLLGLALFALALSGTTAWWPPLRRFGRTLRSRLRPKFDRGSFRAHRDLHDLAGPAVLPLLLVWSVTGAVNGFLSAGPGMEPGSGGTGLHSGAFVPWWVRTVWAAAGLAALHLVGSGLWTWAWRARRTRRAAAARRRTPPAMRPVIPHQRVGEPPAGANPAGAAVERVATEGGGSGTAEPGPRPGVLRRS